MPTMFVSKFSNKALDVPLELYNRDREQWDWGQVQQWDQNGQLQQQWNLIPEDNTPGFFYLVSAISGYYLDVRGASTDNGAQVWVYSENGNDNQQWRLEQRGDFVLIVNFHSGKALDVTDWNPNNGVRLQQWDAAGTDNQLWLRVEL